MAKNPKKPVVNHGRPITAFFSRATKTPTSSQGSPSSSSLSQTNATSLTSGAGSAIEDSPNTKPEKAESEKLRPTSSSLKNATQISAVSAAGSSRKRSRSPDANPPSRTARFTRSPGSKAVINDKTANDSDIDMGDFVAQGKTTAETQSKKRPRISSPLKLPLQNITEVIPSSQSDEEAPFAKVDIDLPTILVHDSQPSSHPGTPNQHTSGSMSIGLGTAFSSPGRSYTPPSSHLSSLPATPVALDVASKTAKIIADIKARAYARNTPSPEPVFEFNDILESSSDEEDIMPLNIIAKKIPSPKVTPPVEPTRRSTRYSLRNRSPTSSKASPPEASTSKIPSHKTKVSSPKTRTKKSTQNVPFEALLKEKRSAEKRGDWTNVFDRAEAAASKSVADNLLHNEFDLEEEDEPLTWDAFSRAARDPQWLSSSKKSMTPSLNRTTIPGIKLGPEDQKRLFGEEKAKEIADILQHDRIEEQHANSSVKAMGIQIWNNLSVESEIDASPVVDDTHSFITRLPGSSSPIHCINSALTRRDFLQVTMLLNMDIINIISPSERIDFVSSICELALRAGTHALAEPAVRCLERFWSSGSQPSTSSISFSQILDTLHLLKIKNDVLEQQWKPSNSIVHSRIDVAQRRVVIDYLVILITACARTKRLQEQDLADILIALVFLAMDMDASAELVQDITQAIDLVCGCIKPADLETQSVICTKILKCVASYSPVNKYHVVLLFAGGSRTARKLADVFAHCIITNKTSVNKSLLSDLPPLSDILDELPPNAKSKGPAGKFSVHDETDYVDLGLYVCILAVTISDVRGYVFQDAEIADSHLSNSLASPTKNTKERLTNVQYLHNALENLHSSITDMRAAHLERSRTKAIIKGLSMNVYYQHKLWSDRLRTKPRRVTIDKWLNKNDKA